MIRMLLLSLAASLFLQEAPACDKGASEIDTILTRLEEKGDEIKDLSCDLEYRIDDRINLDVMTKYGGIRFMRAKPHDTFLIHFHKLVQDDIPTKKKEWYLFADRWFWEVKERTTTITKREMVAKDQTVDLFDVDTAPFPVPFGQKKDDILKNFEVTLVPPAKGDPENTDHLVCLPRPNTGLAKDYEKLEFHISRETHLPVRIVTTELKGNKVTTAVFLKVRINAGLTEKDFAPRAEWKTYKTSVEPLAKPQQPPPSE